MGYSSVAIRLALVGSQIHEISRNSDRIRVKKVIDLGVNGKRIYTVSQKTVPLFTAYNFRNIEQIFAQVKVSSFWTSCQSLFKSMLENSGAI